MFGTTHEAHAAVMRARAAAARKAADPVEHKAHPRKVRVQCDCGRCGKCRRRASQAAQRLRTWMTGYELIAPPAPITTALMCADYGELFGMS